MALPTRPLAFLPGAGAAGIEGGKLLAGRNSPGFGDFNLWIGSGPRPTVLGIMTHLNQMVDLMLTGPMARFCMEEALELFRRFNELTPPK